VDAGLKTSVYGMATSVNFKRAKSDAYRTDSERPVTCSVPRFGVIGGSIGFRGTEIE
jgi:hypothetical protein